MGRKKKIKPNEIEQSQADAQTKGTFESSENESNSNVTGFEPSSENNNSETEKKIDEILSGFSNESETKDETVNISPSANDFKPRTRGRKPKEVEPPKPVLKVPGKLFLSIHSKIAVTAISILDRYIDKNNPIPESYQHAIGLDPDQLNDSELILMAENAIREMKLEDSPITVFYGSLGALFLSNYMSLKQFLRSEALKRKEALAQEIAEGKKQQRNKRNAR